MAKDRTSYAMQEQIRTLVERGYSLRSISKSLRVSRKTIRRILGERKEVAHISPHEDGSLAAVNWEEVQRESALGVTFKQLHTEHSPGSSYWAFRRAFLKLKKVTPSDVSIRLQHKPGERTQVDYDDGISIVDRVSGVATKTYLFCGVLPFSDLTYGEFVLNQKIPSWLASHDRMWAYFGGISTYVIVDNLKAGVNKAHLYDPDVNPTFCDYANHNNFSVVPARPRHPRDKAAVENAFSVIEKTFFHEVRKKVFYSLEDLNEDFWDYLHRMNTWQMKDYGVSRRERFEVEKSALQAIPQTRFEITEWRHAKVHPDCHVQVEKNYYSVPYKNVGKSVRIRLSAKLLEIFNGDGEAIAAHGRLYGIGKYSTVDSHYPEQKLAVVRFEIVYAKQEAKKIGPEMVAFMDTIFSVERPLKNLRLAQGVLRLFQSQGFSKEAMEYAAKQALTFQRLRLAYIKDCAVHFQVHGNRPHLAAPKRNHNDCHLHLNYEKDVQ